MLDCYVDRAQQAQIDQVVAHKMVRVYLSGLFQKDDDAEEDTDSDESKTQSFIEVYNTMLDKLKSIGLETSKGAEPIRLNNFLVLWILLGVGFISAWTSFAVEILVKARGKCTFCKFCRKNMKHGRTAYIIVQSKQNDEG